MTNEQLNKLGIESKWLDAINDTFERFEINNKERQIIYPEARIPQLV